MIYDSKTQLIQLTDKVVEKVPWTICKPDKKKRKKYPRVRNELSIMDNIKALKYKSCPSFRACQKNFFEFTDSTQAIYWPTDQQIYLKKQQTVELDLPIYVSTKYLPI